MALPLELQCDGAFFQVLNSYNSNCRSCQLSNCRLIGGLGPTLSVHTYTCMFGSTLTLGSYDNTVLVGGKGCIMHPKSRLRSHRRHNIFFDSGCISPVIFWRRLAARSVNHVKESITTHVLARASCGAPHYDACTLTSVVIWLMTCEIFHTSS